MDLSRLLGLRQPVGLGLLGVGVVVGVLLALREIHPVAVAALLWVGLVALLLSAAYVVQLVRGDGGRLFFKGADGGLPWWVYLVFFPFIASRYLNLLVLRTLTREPALTRVDEGVLVGGRLFPWEGRLLKEHAVRAVLDATAELPRDLAVRDSGVAYKAVPVLDGSGPTVEQLRQGVEWALEHLDGRGPLLFQCTVGHGRSATFAAGVLLALGRVKTVEEAVELMRAKRGRVGLNREQRRRLEMALDGPFLARSQGVETLERA